MKMISITIVLLATGCSLAEIDPVVDTAAQVAGVFGQELAVPFTVLTTANGALIGVHTGEISDDQLIAFAETLSDLEVGRVGIETARSRLVEAGIGVNAQTR